MQEPESWRKILDRIIGKDSKERQRLAEILGVNPVTLSRWAAGETNPRQQNL